MNAWIITFVFCRNIYGKKELWLVITGYSVIIAIVYLCNGEMDACYEIKDSQFIDIPNTIDSKVRING